MTTYRTGNAIGSADPRDLYDNAENLDELVNSQDKAEHPDRLGVPRKTWHGMEEDFQSFLQSSGYQDLGDYAAGIEITARNQIIRADGELWRLSASEDLPYTTSGDWAADSGDFVAMGDAVLRQEIKADAGSELVGYKESNVFTELEKIDGIWNGKESLVDFANDLSGELLALKGSTYKFNSGIVVNNENIKYIQGNGSTLDFSDSSQGLVIEGQLEYLEGATGTFPVGGSSTILSTGLNIEKGDILVVWNPVDYSMNAYRAYYRDGFMIKVSEYNSDTGEVHFFGPIPSGSYAATQIYKLNGGSLAITGLTIIPPKNGIGLTISCRNGVSVDSSVRIAGGGYAGLNIDRCFDLSIEGGGFDADFSDSYPILIANTQNFRISNVSAFSMRHSIGLGGSGEVVAGVPTRDGLITNSILYNDSRTGIGSSDSHGNCVNIRYSNCILKNGATLGGAYIYYNDCTIHAMKSGHVVTGSELPGGTYSFKNIDLILDSIDTSIPPVPYFAITSSSVTRSVNLTLNSINIVSNINVNAQSRPLVLFRQGEGVTRQFHVKISNVSQEYFGGINEFLILSPIGNETPDWGLANVIIDDSGIGRLDPGNAGRFVNTVGGSGTPYFRILSKRSAPISAGAVSGEEIIANTGVSFPRDFPKIPHVLRVDPSSNMVGGRFIVMGGAPGSTSATIMGRSIDGPFNSSSSFTFTIQAALNDF